jgi:superfamily II DNA or RNA helicase
MASFAEFLKSLDADGGKRGKQFEHFVKWFLKNDPEWTTQVDKVWLWNDYPERWGRDCGIDLVFKDKNDATWAVQAKCYSPDYVITKADVDRFLSESNREQINHRLLIATTDRLGANARQVIDSQEKSVVRYHLTDFEKAAVEYPDSIKRLSAGKRKPPPEPHLYQIEAVENVILGFQKSGRGQLIKACGTGKTFVCLWVKERLKAKRTLVCVPSLGLLSEILNKWTSAAKDKFDALCVCSDQTVNRRKEDESISLVSDLPFPVSSDVAEIAHFLRRDDDQVIFSTYQSSPLIAQAQSNADIPSFDLVIADEAHRCAGKTDSWFATVLDDRLIKSDKRLFATATPRIYKTSLKKTAEEFGVEVVDMSDETIFGQRFHTLTFGEAIERDALTDYRVLIVGVNDARIKEWIENRRLVATDTGFTTDARSLAGQIGLLKAIKDWNLQRLISFHGRVKRAQAFSEDIIQVADWLDNDHKPARNLWADYVSGEMPAFVRAQKLGRLENIGKDKIGLLSNARCLSEGVDVPALDGVAFIDPRSSEIDIVQCVGRAIRLSESKVMGTIVIPVFVEQTDDAQAALEASEFKPIWDVLEALKSHDDKLSSELDQLRIELGAKRKRSVGANDLTKIVLDLPTSVNEDFAQSLRAHLVAQTTESWMFWYGLLESFVKEHGHCRVPKDYEDNGFRLGGWVNNQRGAKERMPIERRQRLDRLGFIWDSLEEDWAEGFSHLKIYQEREGDCRVPQGYLQNGYRLGQWVSVQRGNKDRLSCQRHERLDELGFIWDPSEADWQEGLRYLTAYKKRTGHCRVPALYKEQGYPLGWFVRKQRTLQDTLSKERQQKLNDLDFVWDPRNTDWEKGFHYLTRYKKRTGHCRVAADHIENGFRLGQWVQKRRERPNILSDDQKRMLNDIGFVWNAIDDRWETGFRYLTIYCEREGHCRVPAKHKEKNGFRLGQWVSVQRLNTALSENRRQRLNNLGFIWNPHDAVWEEGFQHLKAFVKEHNHCRVPTGYKSKDGYRLGKWTVNQRSKCEALSSERKAQLDALGFIWNTRGTGVSIL